MNIHRDPYGISVLIVNWNSHDDLLRCLNSLSEQDDRDFEVVVVDNGSSDGSCEMVKARFPDVKLLETGENLGFAEGCNRGLLLCERAWVFMLNNDTRLDPRAILELRTAAKQGGAQLGMLQARILFMDQPHLTNSTGVLLQGKGVLFIDRDFAAPVREGDTQEEIFCVSAGAALYRRDMLDAVRLPTGVFDRSFFMYYEDVDLGWRCRLAGYSAQYVPQALVYHRFQASSSRRSAAFVATHCHANKIRTLLKNASLRYLRKALPFVLKHDVAPLLRHRPAAALGLIEDAIRDGLVQRKLVTALSRRSRGEVERDWVT